MSKFKEFEQIINYSFKDKSLLEEALTHSSCSSTKNNQRLEFFGDAVLQFISSEYIFAKHQKQDEGYMSKMRILLVSTSSLVILAEKISLGTYLLFSKGEKTSGPWKDKSLADGFEALISAIYLDSNVEVVKGFYISLVEKYLLNLEDKILEMNPKGALQEFTQNKFHSIPEYKLISHQGPDHKRIFLIEVYIQDKCYGKGSGTSKKEAEQNAAKLALEKIKHD